VFVLPSALEGLPITLLEAMSHGRPCLASDIPPHRGIIRDRQNGFLHRAEDFGHLRARLSDVIHTDSHELATIGKSAREVVTEEYDWENVADRTERLYETLLGAGGSPRCTSVHKMADGRTLEKI
jgi:glycosyltransferase involved in cell wall biosynthesis